jgi:hypothetical protein
LQPGRFVFDVNYRFDPKNGKLQDAPQYEYKSYFSLMSYLVYYPLLWYLEQLRGWTAVHASALACRQGAVIIAGVGGVGKTTTCVALMQQAGMTLISENLVLTDGEHVYPCYEPVRLDPGSLAILGDDLRGLTPMAFPDGLKDKSLFHVDAGTRSAKFEAALLLLPTFSAQRYVRPLPAAVAARRIVAMNRLTLELDDFGWYAAAANLVWTGCAREDMVHAVPHRLASRARCFELGIDRSAGAQAVVEDIVGLLGDGRGDPPSERGLPDAPAGRAAERSD